MKTKRRRRDKQEQRVFKTTDAVYFNLGYKFKNRPLESGYEIEHSWLPFPHSPTNGPFAASHSHGKPESKRRTRTGQTRDVGSIYVSGKLPTYPSPKSTLTLTSHLGQNVGLGEGKVDSFSETYIDLRCTRFKLVISCLSPHSVSPPCQPALCFCTT